MLFLFISLPWLSNEFLWSINKLKQGLWRTIWLSYICIYIYIYIYKIYIWNILNSNTQVLMNVAVINKNPRMRCYRDLYWDLYCSRSLLMIFKKRLYTALYTTLQIAQTSHWTIICLRKLRAVWSQSETSLSVVFC